MNWIMENIGTIITALILLFIIGMAVRSMIRKKKAGQTCGCGCSSCAMSGSCGKRST